MNWRIVKQVAFREISTRGRTKAFRIVTAILLGAAVVIPIAIALWPDSSDEPREVAIGVVRVDDETVALLESSTSADFRAEFVDLELRDVDDELIAGTVDVVLVPGPTLVWLERVDLELSGALQRAIQQRDVLVRGRWLGLDEQQVGSLLTPTVVGEDFIEGSGENEDLVFGVGFVGLLAAFMLPQIYGQLTLVGVAEEKSSGVVEVLLGHIHPRALLMGKVLGIGALAAMQFALIVAGLVAALLVANRIEVPPEVWRFVPVISIAALGGLAVYITLFAILGSLISRQEDAAQVIAPALLPIMGGFFLAQVALAGDPESLVVQVGTLFPLTMPMLLPIRVARDAIPAWELGLSIGLLLVAVWVMVAAAARLYEFTLLHSGARVPWREIPRMLRGDVSG